MSSCRDGDGNPHHDQEMSMSADPSRGYRPEDDPIAWFAQMKMATEEGNVRQAAAAQRELKELGWRVEPIKAPRSGRRRERASHA